MEPIAPTAGTPPRTLQRFLESVPWDEQRLRDRQQQFVAREHAHPRAIGVIDESGNPKKGRHSAAVKRRWCGRTGKIDNCVMGVRLSYVAGDFRVWPRILALCGFSSLPVLLPLAALQDGYEVHQGRSNSPKRSSSPSVAKAGLRVLDWS